jgi:TRAP-type C4-dicarboxylate transport system substrate-binding protein
MINNKKQIVKCLIFLSLAIGMLFIYGCSGKEKATTAGSEKQATQQKTWRLSTMYTQSHPYFKVVEDFVSKVEKNTNGLVKIQVIPGSAAMPSTEEYDGVKSRAIEIAFVPPSYSEGKNPILGSNILFGWYSYDGWGKMHSEYTDIMNKSYFYNQGVISYPNIIASYAFVSKKPVQNVSQLKGKTTRSGSGVFGEILKAWGMVPVNITATEVYEGLQKGIIDTAFVVYSRIDADKLLDVAPYFLAAEKGMMSAVVGGYFINKQAVDELPKEAQDGFYKALSENFDVALKISQEEDLKSYDKLKTQAKTFVNITGETETLHKLTEPVLDAYASKNGEVGQKLIELVKANAPK